MSLINSNRLKGSDAVNRARQLMSLNESVQPSVNRRGFMDVKQGSDNYVYAIVKESAKYFIKKAKLSENIHHSEFDYVNGESSKTNYMFEGYNLALKSLNNITIALNESFGRAEEKPFEIDFLDRNNGYFKFGDDIEVVDENDDYDQHGHIEFDDDDDIFGEDRLVSKFEQTENSMFEALDELDSIVEEGLKKKN